MEPCFAKESDPFAEHAIQDGRIITGQNPESPRAPLPTCC